MKSMIVSRNRSASLPLRVDSVPQRVDEVDVRALFAIVNGNRRFILIGTAVFMLAGLLYVMAATPVYEANAMVQVERSTPSVPGQAPLGQMAEVPRSQAATEIPLLTSRSLLGEAVRALSLDIRAQAQRLPLLGNLVAHFHSPDRPGAVAPPPFGLSRYGWGGEKIAIEQLDVPDTLLDRPLTLVAGASGSYALADDSGVLLRGKVGEFASGRGVAMRVGELRANPGTRFDVVRRSELAAVMQLAGGVAAGEKGRDSGIIALTYRDPDPVLAAQVLDRITTAYVRQNVRRNSAEAENSLQFVNEQLPKVRTELARAQTALKAFQSSAGTVDIGMETQALLNQTVALNTSLQTLRTQQPEIARRYTSEHPAHKALQKQIAELEGDKSALQARMAELPGIQQGLFQLTRDVEVTNRTYTNLLDQAQQLDIARASAIGNVSVVDKPAVDMATPVWPMKLPIIAAATLLGAMLASAFVFARQLLKRGVQDPADIERLGLPVYASILHSSKQRAIASRSNRRYPRPRLLALNAPTDVAMEALRGLRTSLHFSRIEPKNSVLMVSGASAGAGKSFICSNLAVTTAQAGQRVLLIDADMRRGTLHETIGARHEDGLSELISGQIDVETAVRDVGGTENLFFISRGRVPPNPSELLMHPRFATLLQGLAADFDLVIIDTPPVLAVTDAAVIGHHVGTTLLVVRHGVDQTREIALAKQRLEQNGIKVHGAIVNGIEKRSAGHYAYTYYEHQPHAG